MTETGQPLTTGTEVPATAPPDEATVASPSPTVVEPTAPSAKPQPRRTRRLIAWLVAAAALSIGALLTYRTVEGSDAYRLGRAIGTVLAPLLVVFAIRLVLMRMQHRPWRNAYMSGWLPLGTLIVVALSATSSISRLAPPASADPNTALRIAAPWTLDLGETATLSQLTDRLKAEPAVRSVAARHVSGPDGESAFLVVTDSALRSDASADELARGIAGDGEVPSTIESIRDHRVAIVDRGSVSIAAWVESPFLVSIYAADDDSARAIADAVLDVTD